jgi:hypothetical protein
MIADPGLPPMDHEATTVSIPDPESDAVALIVDSRSRSPHVRKSVSSSQILFGVATGVPSVGGCVSGGSVVVVVVGGAVEPVVGTVVVLEVEVVDDEVVDVELDDELVDVELDDVLLAAGSVVVVDAVAVVVVSGAVVVVDGGLTVGALTSPHSARGRTSTASSASTSIASTHTSSLGAASDRTWSHPPSADRPTA